MEFINQKNKSRTINQKNKSRIQYPSIPSVIRPVQHCDEIPVSVYKIPGLEPLITDCYQFLPDPDPEISDVESPDDSRDEDFIKSKPLQTFNREELNDLVRDLALSKAASELLASRLHQKNLLSPLTKISYHRDREQGFLLYFAQRENCVYCCDIEGLLKELGLKTYDADEWRLFIDSSKRSLKVVLLHNGNLFGSIPLAHSVTLRERYENIDLVLQLISYDQHKWIICVDLKMVCFLLGQQSVYTKYPCFLCMWDSRAKNEHWIRKEWPKRQNLIVGSANVINEALVEREKIVFPPLHIKLGLIKQFVKALNKDGYCIKYLRTRFHRLSDKNVKSGIFNRPDIRKLIKDPEFTAFMMDTEYDAWQAFVSVVKGFLGNRRDDNYVNLVNSLL